MVLADLGRKINNAFAELQRAPVVDDKVSLMRRVLNDFRLNVLIYRSSMRFSKMFARPCLNRT